MSFNENEQKFKSFSQRKSSNWTLNYFYGLIYEIYTNY